jgi:hypothetical protein
MDLDALLPIIDDIVKESLSEKVYIYGRYQRGLTNRVASGNLKNSIRSVVKTDRQGLQVIQLTAFGQPLSNTYAYWLINNRQAGKRPPSGDIAEWIMQKKSFRIRDMKTGKFLPKTEKNVKRVAYVIARSIGQFGFQNIPKNFIEVSLEKLSRDPRIEQIITDVTVKEFFENLEGI